MNKQELATNKIYSKWLIDTTKSVLKKNIVLPDEISLLVQEVYKRKDNESLDYIKYSKRNEDAHMRAENKCLKIKDSYFVDETMHGILDDDIVLDSDNDASCCVRDIGMTIRVIIVCKREDGLIHCFCDNDLFNVTQALDDDTAKKIAMQTISLPSIFLHERYGEVIKELSEHTITDYEEWLKSGWLKDSLFLTFDENGFSTLNGQKLHYDSKYGLEIIRKEGEK